VRPHAIMKVVMSRIRKNPVRERNRAVAEGLSRLRKASRAGGSREALLAARESVEGVGLRGARTVVDGVNGRLHALATRYPLNRFRDGPGDGNKGVDDGD